jgi:hypothetical protein
VKAKKSKVKLPEVSVNLLPEDEVMKLIARIAMGGNWGGSGETPSCCRHEALCQSFLDTHRTQRPCPAFEE